MSLCIYAFYIILIKLFFKCTCTHEPFVYAFFFLTFEHWITSKLFDFAASRCSNRENI